MDFLKLKIKQGFLSGIIEYMVSVCDAEADFCSLSNDKAMEDYWRRAATSLYDAGKKIGDKPAKSLKF